MYSYIDMHCDSLLRVLAEGEESLYNGKGMQSIQKMARAGQMCQFFAIFFRPEWKLIEAEQDVKMMGKVKETGGECESGGSVDAVCFEALRNALYRQVEAHPTEMAMAYNYAQIQKNRSLGRASAVLSIEDGRIVKGSLERLVWLYEKGVRSITLTWNMSNCFGYPHSKDKKEMGRSLTAFGRTAVEEMNRLGILIDVSHLSDGGFFDVATLSSKPFVASHSNCRALVPHTRNLSDDMIRLLAERGGVAGVNLYPSFVIPTENKRFFGAVRGGSKRRGLWQKDFENVGFDCDTCISDYIEALVSHVLHFIKVGGEECIGIGTDFDGMEESPEICSPSEMELLFDALMKRGMTPRQLDKFLSGNVLRVVKETMR